jgi:hypothetical protein
METLGELLARQRRRSFVGRDAELELARSVLDGDGPPVVVLYVHGPGGIGKSSLLARIADLGAEGDTAVVRLDGHHLAPDERTLVEAIGGELTCTDDGHVDGHVARRLLLLVDGYERLARLDGWFRTELLPRLNASSLVVLASRKPPDPAWRSDPGWRDLVRVVTLRNLEPDDCRTYLEGCGVPADEQTRLAALSHGHPLALALMADMTLRGGSLGSEPFGPDLVGALLSRFLDSVPDESRRRALGAAALARVTTESLLRDVVGHDASETFRWLSELSCVEAVADGLALHDVARDALVADLRWRDPDIYGDLFRSVRDHVCRWVTTSAGAEQRRAIHDLKFLFRLIPGLLSPVDWDSWGGARPEPAQPRDRDEILELIALHAGGDAARIAATWWSAQPEAFVVTRDGSAITGVIALVDLTDAPPEVRDADPAARSAWEHVHRASPPRPGERVTQTRIIVDRQEHQRPSATLNLVPVLTLQRYLQMPELAWDVLTLADPDQWDEYFAVADLPRIVGGDVEIGGRVFGLFAHDFRGVPVDDLIRLWTERALSQGDLGEPARTTPETLVLSQTEFREVVRDALGQLRRPELLHQSLLCRTRLARTAAGPGHEPDASTIESLIMDGVDSLRRDPRDAKRLRAIERTYLVPTPSQEAAAEVLGLPSSTYRRHLSQGVERIVAWLWDQEVHGSGP